MSVKSLRVRLREAEQALKFEKGFRDLKGLSAAAESRQRQAAKAHRDGTARPVKQGKSKATPAIVRTGIKPGDVAMTNIPQLVRVRETFGKE